ncbi:MAG: Tn3 family transposase [Thermoleophilaceae bacterium]|nr:Tn3 family transposase [Thermoleophilaceae bacterium]
MPDRSYPEVPADPGDEELARDWTLSAADQAEVLRCRGDANRHRFAVQLCALRALGRFVDDFAAVPVRVANHVGRQLGLPPSLFMESTDRAATATEHTQRIREYLECGAFDAAAQERLKQWMSDRAAEGILPTPLLALAVNALRSWRVELPARSTLERLAGAASARGEEETWRRVGERLPPEFCAAVDALIGKGDHRSPLFQFKQYPPEPKAAAIKDYLERFERLRAIGADRVDFSGLQPDLLAHLAELGRRYDVKELRRFAPAKRHALVACFLADAQKTTLDHLVEMNRGFLTTMHRHARNAVEERHREVRQRANKGLTTVLRALEVALDRSRPAEARLAELDGDEATLREAVATCRDFQALADYGLLDELKNRHSGLKRYLTGFLTLPFRGERGAEPLLAALELARKLNAGEVERLPADAPVQFVPAGWRGALLDDSGRPDRRLWEIALAFAVRDRLRSGDLFLAESRHHVSFWNLVYAADLWEKKRAAAYGELDLPNEADRALDKLRAELGQAASALAAGLDSNRFATLRDGRLEYSVRDGINEPERVGQLRRVIEAHLPRIRIEDLLLEVDSWCGFTRELLPLGGYQPRADNLYAALLAALVAHGTNLGISTMAQSTKGIGIDLLHHISQWYLRQDTLRAANRVLVDYHHRLPLSSVWGDGVSSSSDGQRFGVQASSLLASFYPRYFGYYDRAITVYTHVSDQFTVFASRAISCSPREAIFVLDGLLENDTILRPREHYTDTHGFTEQLFGLCYLLGFSFMPRLKDLKDQQLYKLDRSDFGELGPIFRSSVDVALIREQWDQLVRVASSLRNRTAPAHVVLERLAASSPTDRLAKALTMLGRVAKTAHILRYAHDAKVRDRVQLQLNRGESRHALARRLFFANQGAFRSGDYEEIMNKVSALSLLSNAVLVWNTVRMAEIVRSLEEAGQVVAREDLARISPLHRAHVIPSGTYHFDRQAEEDQPLE